MNLRVTSGFGFLLLASTASGAGMMFGNREPVDLAKASGEASVLLVGDDHTKPAIKNFLAESLADLKSRGFTVLAVEMVPVNLQEDLDAWTPAARGRISQHLSSAWGEKGPGVADSMFSLIDQAKRDGLSVLALDPTDAHRFSRTDVNPFWANRVQGELEGRRGTRLIVFAGRSHVDPVPRSLTSILEAAGVSCSIVRFAGMDDRDTVEMDLKTARLLNRPARATTLFSALQHKEGRRAPCMVTCRSELYCKNASNWIISLPEQAPLYLAQK